MTSKDQFGKILESLAEIRQLLAEQNKYRFAEQYLDNNELISILGISKRTAQTWRETGIIPYAQLGRKIYYRLTDLEFMFENEFKKSARVKKTEKRVREKHLSTKPGKNPWVIRL